MEYESIAAELYPHLNKKLIDQLLEFYQTAKSSQLRGDWEKAALNAGKFSETIVKILLEYTGIRSSGGFKFEKSYRLLLNHPKQNDLDKVLTHLIPMVARVAYTLRNKRGVAHSDEIAPNFLDASYMSSCCDWMLSELLRVYHKSSNLKIERRIASLIKRKIPAVQEIDKRTLVLKTGLSARNEILVILSHHYPESIPESKLLEDIEFHSKSNVRTSLRNLEKSRMIFRNDGEVILTDGGLLFVDSDRFQKQLILEDS